MSRRGGDGVGLVLQRLATKDFASLGVARGVGKLSVAL